MILYRFFICDVFSDWHLVKIIESYTNMVLAISFEYNFILDDTVFLFLYWRNI